MLRRTPSFFCRPSVGRGGHLFVMHDARTRHTALAVRAIVNVTLSLGFRVVPFASALTAAQRAHVSKVARCSIMCSPPRGEQASSERVVA